jgi:hypothetical protein
VHIWCVVWTVGRSRDRFGGLASALGYVLFIYFFFFFGKHALLGNCQGLVFSALGRQG